MSTTDHSFVDGLLARAREEVGRENPTTWIFKEHGAELAGILVEKGVFEYDGEVIPTRTLHRPDHGDYVRYMLWPSPAKLVELDNEHNPQIGDFLYVKVEKPRPKRDKPGESFTPCYIRVIPAAEVDAVANKTGEVDGDEPQEPLPY